MAVTVSVLLENTPGSRPGNNLQAKAGLSLFIEDDSDSVLFDTGPDNSFMINAERMGITITDSTTTVLSHGHYDHAGGVSCLPVNSRIVCHPDVGCERYSAVTFAGHTARIKKLSRDNDYSRFRMDYSKGPLRIGERFLWSGEIPVARPRPYGIIAGATPSTDYVKDEGVLIYRSDRGLIIFIGCGHRGLIETVQYCQKITGVEHIHALFGGFHLRCASPLKLWKVSRFLRIQKPDKIMGCHCTGTWGRLWLPSPVITPVTGEIYKMG